nr:MAG TPA: hypothetical protein [Bacteriophage sp.]
MKIKGENQTVEMNEQEAAAVQKDLNSSTHEAGDQEVNKEMSGERQKRSGEEKVTFRLFKDNDKYKAPVFVGVNGTGYLVERGKDVTMPKSVYEVLKNSEEQLAEAAKIMEEAEYKEG